MPNSERLYNMSFTKLYPNYIVKAASKNRTKEEVDAIFVWLFGYDLDQINDAIINEISVRDFFNLAPKLNDNAALIKGKICGVTIELITDPLMKKIRYLDKLVDELAKGKSLEKILNRVG